jgi:hypothetical protein
MMAIETVSDASAIGITALSAKPRAEQRQAGEGVAEEEPERYGERDRAPVGPSERGADDHAEHLADCAAGEALQCGAERHRVERLLGGTLARVGMG